MTYVNLFFNLLKEDLKRRTWAIALTFLTFFFSLPIGMALAMEGAERSYYMSLKDSLPSINDGGLLAEQMKEKLLSLRVEVVMNQAGFGRGVVPFLLVVLGIVMGVSSFAYLHNKKKVDFYHSLPVKREVMFCSQFVGGILIVGLSYGLNLLLLAMAAMFHEVPLGGIAGELAGGWAVNMLYFMLMYGTAVVAMLMTGNVVVGLMAVLVFYFFLPIVTDTLSYYCGVFFVTASGSSQMDQRALLGWGMNHLSPFTLYMKALSWELKDFGNHVTELFLPAAAFLAVTFLSLKLYSIRPSEAAGRAMAFRWSKSPVRMILVIGFALSGGLLFWSFQSGLKWGLFGVAAFAVLSHCIIEIIYHFDFKKLFSKKIHLGIELAAAILLFLSFRFDWYGYDSYIPEKSRVASVSLRVREDQWNQQWEFEEDEEGYLSRRPVPYYDSIGSGDRKLTDIDEVMKLVNVCVDRTLKSREDKLGGRRDQWVYQTEQSRLTLGEGEKEEFFTRIFVCYEMKDGRKVSREYENIPLSAVMEAYRSIYNTKEYKQGVYGILNQDLNKAGQVWYREANQMIEAGQDRRDVQEMLAAYQADLMDLTVENRMREAPIGTIAFLTDDEMRYLQQKKERVSVEYSNFWPVYPSFTRTIKCLKDQGITPGAYFTPEAVSSVEVDVEWLFQNGREEELSALQQKNPNYKGGGILEFEDQEDIKLLMDAMVQEEYYDFDYLYTPTESPFRKIRGKFILPTGETMNGVVTGERITPEFRKLFQGIPVEEDT